MPIHQPRVSRVSNFNPGIAFPSWDTLEGLSSSKQRASWASQWTLLQWAVQPLLHYGTDRLHTAIYI